MKKKAKVQFLVWLPRKVDTKFREMIQQKYQKYEKGLLSYEAEMAIRHWLSLHTNAQTDLDTAPKPNPTPKVQLVFAQIKEYLLSNHYFQLVPGQQVPRFHLVKAIENVRGSDKRTVAKWFRSFHRNGLIKPVTSATWEII